MQDAIQSQKKIEESLYNFGCDHTGGKNAWLQPKIIYLKRKGLFLRTKPSHLGEARGGRRASATWLECPVFTGHTRNVKPPYSAYVCVCVWEGCCFMLDWMLSAFLFWSGNDEKKWSGAGLKRTDTDSVLGSTIHSGSWVNWGTSGDKCWRNDTFPVNVFNFSCTHCTHVAPISHLLLEIINQLPNEVAKTFSHQVV